MMAEQWILDLTNELQVSRSPPDQEAKSIYRVPRILRDVNRQAYEPIMISFGPYHHDSLHLRPMEQNKHRALIHFLHRIFEKSSKTPKDVLAAMREVEHLLLASYDNLQIDCEEEDEHCLERSRVRRRNWLSENDEFLKLMIIDGCFALEFMHARVQGNYDPHDPFFGVAIMDHIILDLHDMLLLENQIPLLALYTLAAIDGLEIVDVNNLIKDFYNLPPALANAGLIDEGSSSEQSFHILDLYRKMLTEEGEYFPSYKGKMQSATELRNAGVSFRKSTSKSFRDISFNGGVLYLPSLEIDDMTEPMLRNLIAFEQMHAIVGKEVTAYAFFMDWLINTVNDVALLREEEILMGFVGSDENIANMFNKLTRQVTLIYMEGDEKADVNNKLNRYCKKRMHRWRASFVETYLKNPWVFVSLLGGLLLLALTIVQTVYTMLQYYDA